MNATKFTFDTVFDDAQGEIVKASPTRRRTMTEAEIEQLCADARAEGTKSGEVLALNALAVSTKGAGDAVKAVLGLMARERHGLLEQGARIAFALARKLANAALAEFPYAEVETVLREAMHQAIGEPRIVLKAAPKVAETLQSRLAEIAQEEGFDGRVQVTADASLRNADCRIEWRGGGVERAEAAIEAALEELIARNFRDAQDKGA